MKTLASLALLAALFLTGCGETGNTVIAPENDEAANEGLAEADSELEASIAERMNR